MARLPTGEKRAAIRTATIDELVERGFAGVSVNRVAERADVAVGTIYRHFDSKEALLRSVYLEIKADVHQALMSAAAAHEQPARRVKAVWFALLEYAAEHPHDFLFSESMGAENILSASEMAAVEMKGSELRRIVQDAIASGEVRSAPLPAIMTILGAPAIALARRAALAGEPLDRATADSVFEMCWRAIAFR